MESSTPGNLCKCFLGGLSWDTTEDHLKTYFSKYGDVEEVIVMKDRVTRQPRGFGFITFKESSAAERACAETHVIDGRTVDAKPSVPPGQGDASKAPRSKKIFVGGLAGETTEASFRTYFEQYGTVTDAIIMVDHSSHRSRGFGFITFEEEESVARVFKVGTMHELDGKQVEVKNATPKGSGPVGPTKGLYGSTMPPTMYPPHYRPGGYDGMASPWVVGAPGGYYQRHAGPPEQGGGYGRGGAGGSSGYEYGPPMANGHGGYIVPYGYGPAYGAYPGMVMGYPGNGQHYSGPAYNNMTYGHTPMMMGSPGPYPHVPAALGGAGGGVGTGGSVPPPYGGPAPGGGSSADKRGYPAYPVYLN